MTTSRATHEIVPLPPLQRQAIDWFEINRRRHMMYGLIEVDVTDTRRAIRQYRAQTGAPLSLTTFIIACFARAVGDDRAMHAYRLGSRRLVLFRDVDVGIMVERQVAGEKMPLPYVIRAANAKTPVQVQEEIETAQAADTDAVAVRSLPHWLRPLAVRGLSVWLALPAPLRRLVWGLALRDPYRRKRLTGTVGVTAVGMFGRRAGWGVAPMAHSLTLVVGGLSRKPGVVDGRVEPREILCLTLALDHDVSNGAPAARFVNRLTRLIESGAGLRQPDPEPADAAPARLPREAETIPLRSSGSPISS